MSLIKKDLKNSCPNKEIFIKAFMNEIGLEEKEKFLDHVLSCQKCRYKFEIMKDLMNEISRRRDNIEELEISLSEIKELRKLAKQKIREIERGQRPIILRLSQLNI